MVSGPIHISRNHGHAHCAPWALEAPLGGCWDVDQRLGEEEEEEMCAGDISPFLVLQRQRH